jgi:rhodanese-related sulfurtransferase
MNMPPPLEATPAEVKSRIDSGEKLWLIDVREPYERAQSSIVESELVPMRTVPGALAQLQVKAQEGPLIVFCHHGVRSLNVVHWLREQGIEDCQSMSGGIDAWSVEIDASVPRY